MNYSIEDFFLEFKSPFKIAHGVRTGTDIVILKIEHNGLTAYGEASLPPYLSETKESVHKFIDSFFRSHDNLTQFPEQHLEALTIYTSNSAAKAAVDIAIHNYISLSTGKPVYELLGLKNSPVPLCTYTISMNEEHVIEQKVKEAAEFSILKLKLGVKDDRYIVNTVRKYTDKPICIDANQGWKDKAEALEMLQFLKDNNTLFAEQPMPKDQTNDQKWLFERSPIPLYADESVQSINDLEKLSDSFNGVNIKLMKCGGLKPALEMIRKARELNMEVMIGCMSETGCAVKAASQLSSLADYADLDGPLLSKNNPFNVVHYSEGKLIID